jgi:hypothetical protein
MSDNSLPMPSGPLNAQGYNTPPTTTNTCDVPYCEKTCEATHCFDHTNITCAMCDKFHCNDCSDQIWKGEWTDNTFHKPKLSFIGNHQVFQCAFCRATFDRIIPPSCEVCNVSNAPEMCGYDIDGKFKWYCKTCPNPE